MNLKRRIIFVALLFLFYFSYSQQMGLKFNMYQIEENIFINDSCIEIDFQSFVFYACFSDRNIYSSSVEDSIIVLFEFRIQPYFLDSMSYFTISNINGICKEKEYYLNKEFSNNAVLQLFLTSTMRHPKTFSKNFC